MKNCGTKNQEEMGKHELDKLFSDKLKGYEKTPQVSSWGEIEQDLDKKPARTILPWLGIAASALLAMFSYWYYLDSQAPEFDSQYSYFDKAPNEITAQTRVIILPVFIKAQSSQPKTGQDQQVLTQSTKITKPETVIANNVNTNTEKGSTSLLADNDINDESDNSSITESVLNTELDIEETTALAANNTQLETENEFDSGIAPITIIYKQGEQEVKTNFEKAYAYIGEVGRGEKKLLDFRKLGENIKSKFNSK